MGEGVIRLNDSLNFHVDVNHIVKIMARIFFAFAKLYTYLSEGNRDALHIKRDITWCIQLYLNDEQKPLKIS